MLGSGIGSPKDFSKYPFVSTHPCLIPLTIYDELFFTTKECDLDPRNPSYPPWEKDPEEPATAVGFTFFQGPQDRKSVV